MFGEVNVTHMAVGQQLQKLFYRKTTCKTLTSIPIHPEDAQAQLDRLLNTPAFQQSGTLSKFLKFVVNETLAGRSQELKEYTIALQVLGKKPDFNPQTDPIVRIHAGRLRRALQTYYAQEGQNDPVEISIPKGAYIPNIQWKEKAIPSWQHNYQPPATRRRITVAVLPFSNFNADEQTAVFADGLADHLSTELTRYPELSVISYFSCRQISAQTNEVREAGLMLDAAYILTGSIQTDKEKIRIRVQLILTESREQLWANTYESSISTAGFFEIQDEIAWQVVSQTAGHYGAISRNVARLPPSKNPSDVGVYNAIFWYYHFVKDQSEQMFHKAEAAMRQAVETDPDYALGWAVLGEIMVGGFFMGYQSKYAASQLPAAVEYGRTAITLQPDCQHGYLTMALAHIFLRQHADCEKIVAAWEKVKPPEANIMGAVGFVLICCGHYQRGFDMLDESIQLNPYYQWWFNAGLSFYYLHQQEYDNALYWAEKMNMPEVPWYPILKLAACVALNQDQKAKALREKILQDFPFLKEHANEYLSAFLKDQILINRLQQALLAAEPL
jgi:TolB-like protein/Tfp pilus assembly protein PilF